MHSKPRSETTGDFGWTTGDTICGLGVGGGWGGGMFGLLRLRWNYTRSIICVGRDPKNACVRLPSFTYCNRV